MHSGLSAGAIVGIVIGVLIVADIVVGVVFGLRRRKGRGRQGSSVTQTPDETDFSLDNFTRIAFCFCQTF